MKNVMKMCSVLFVVALLIGCFSIAVSAATIKPGLTVNSKGMVMLGGNVYYGYGLNMYDTFQSHLESYYKYKDPVDEMPRKYKEDFAFCKKYSIQYVRIPFSAWGETAYRLFDEDRDAFFMLMDDVVAEAEKQQVGIVASLLWNMDSLPYYVGEKRSQMGNPSSKTVKFAKEYAGAIVQRYKDSPAIWGWEIGNEYNLPADLCDASFKNYLPGSPFKVGSWHGTDFYTSGEMQVFYREVATVIRKYDKYRMISNGNGEMRGAAYHMGQASELANKDHLWTIDWQSDTSEQFVKVIKQQTPDPIDTLSFHYQAVDYSTDPPQPSTKMYAGGWGTLREAFTAYVKGSRANGRACYFGEFGDFIEIESYYGNPDIEPLIRSLLDDMIAADLQLATGWFPWPKEIDEWGQTRNCISFNEEGLDAYNNRYKVEQLKLTNEQFAKAGKQDVKAYWSALKGVIKTTVATKSTTAKPTTTKTDKTVAPTISSATQTTAPTSGTTESTGSTTGTVTSTGDASSTTDMAGTAGTTTGTTASNGGEQSDGGSLVWLWCVLGGVAVVAVAVILVIVLKKKKG